MQSGDSPRARATEILTTADLEDAGSFDALVPLVYEELHGMARRHLRRERPGHPLQTTGLLHEAYLKLASDPGVTKRGRAYFFAAAARAFRQILVDHARRAATAKRGGGLAFVTLDGREGAAADFTEEIVALDQALTRLGDRHPRLVQVVECRHIAGLTVEETADAIGISPRTVKSDWAMARAWLYDELGGAGGRAAASDPPDRGRA